jgi:hypothetical protein
MHVEYCQNEPAAQEFLEDDDEAQEYFAVSTNPTEFCMSRIFASGSEKRRWLALGGPSEPVPPSLYPTLLIRGRDG